MRGTSGTCWTSNDVNSQKNKQTTEKIVICSSFTITQFPHVYYIYAPTRRKFSNSETPGLNPNLVFGMNINVRKRNSRRPLKIHFQTKKTSHLVHYILPQRHFLYTYFATGGTKHKLLKKIYTYLIQL